MRFDSYLQNKRQMRKDFVQCSDKGVIIPFEILNSTISWLYIVFNEDASRVGLKQNTKLRKAQTRAGTLQLKHINIENWF